MKTKIFTYSLMSLLWLASCTQSELDFNTSDDFDESQFNLPADYEAGWVRIKFTDLDQELNTVVTRNGDISTGIPELDEVAVLLGATQIERVFNEGGKFKERREKYGLHLWYDFYVGEDAPLTRAMSTFSALSFVDIVEAIPLEQQSSSEQERFYSTLAGLNAQSSSVLPFNDPYLAYQWHYYNEGLLPNSVAGCDVNLLPAWEITTGDPRVIVAVIDGGIDHNHPDLAQNMWINTGEIAGNGTDDDNNGYVDDIYGFRFGKAGLSESTGEIFPMDHGTHCAGTIAAVNNNGIGVGGVAGGNGNPNTGIRLMSCQTYVPDPAYPDAPHSNSKSTSRTPDAYAYAADNGAVIANCSFMYGGTSLTAAYKAGIDYFIDNAGIDINGNQVGPLRGGLVVASAGNDGAEMNRYPAAYTRVLSVAALAGNYKKTSYSTYNKWVNISAPGGRVSDSYGLNRAGGVFSTIAMDSDDYNLLQGYRYMQGTSMAAPHVTGIAALVLSVAVQNDINLTVDELTAILLDTSKNIDSYNSKYKDKIGVGLVDAYAAIEALF